MSYPQMQQPHVYVPNGYQATSLPMQQMQQSEPQPNIMVATEPPPVAVREKQLSALEQLLQQSKVSTPANEETQNAEQSATQQEWDWTLQYQPNTTQAPSQSAVHHRELPSQQEAYRQQQKQQKQNNVRDDRHRGRDRDRDYDRERHKRDRSPRRSRSSSPRESSKQHRTVTVTPCRFFASKAGCQRPHCPFLHDMKLCKEELRAFERKNQH